MPLALVCFFILKTSDYIDYGQDSLSGDLQVVAFCIVFCKKYSSPYIFFRSKSKRHTCSVVTD